MYDKYFGLTDKPFSIAPDPRYLFMSEQHREALAHLVYGIGEGGGFVLLSGEVGTGKTTVCRCLLEQIPEHTHIAFILNPKLSTRELLATVCDELHIQYSDQSSLKDLNDALNEFLLESHAEGFKVVLMIDEAQNLSTEILEQIRLLTNLETNKEKLLQIILIGQPELNDILGKHELRQLAQRITARYHLTPLDLEECESYIHHRLEVSGFHDNLFDHKAIRELFRRTGGVPRLINVLCDRAMLGAYAKNRRQIGPNVIKKAANEIMGGDTREAQADTIKPEHTPGHRWRLAAYALSLILVVAGSYLYYRFQQFEIDSQLAIEQTAVDKASELKTLQEMIEQQDAQLKEITNENLQLKETITAMQNEANPVQEVVINDGMVNQIQQLAIDGALSDQSTLHQTIVESDVTEQLLPVLPFLPARIQPEDEQVAHQALLNLWDMPYQPEQDGDICDFARNNQLKCELEIGGWWFLRIIDRPVMLKLISKSGQNIYGVLVALDKKNAIINFSGEDFILNRELVSEYWSGEYLLLWQAPPDYHQPLSLSMQGNQIQWLLTKLGKLENLDMIVPPDVVFDEKVQAKVKQFQLQHSLSPDGIVGLQTLTTLNRLINRTTPTLTSGSAG